MKTILSLLLASGLPLAACAADQSVDLELALGLADTHEGGSLGAAQLGMTWYPTGRIGIEAWFGASADNSLEVVPGPTTSGEENSWINRMHGFGLRYRFFGDEQRRWQPFVRAGLARADVSYEIIGMNYLFDGTIEYDRYEGNFRRDSVYYGFGTGYTLDNGWRLSAQILHVPLRVMRVDLARTEALVGIQYAF